MTRSLKRRATPSPSKPIWEFDTPSPLPCRSVVEEAEEEAAGLPYKKMRTAMYAAAEPRLSHPPSHRRSRTRSLPIRNRRATASDDADTLNASDTSCSEFESFSGPFQDDANFTYASHTMASDELSIGERLQQDRLKREIERLKMENARVRGQVHRVTEQRNEERKDRVLYERYCHSLLQSLNDLLENNEIQYSLNIKKQKTMLFERVCDLMESKDDVQIPPRLLGIHDFNTYQVPEEIKQNITDILKKYSYDLKKLKQNGSRTDWAYIRREMHNFAEKWEDMTVDVQPETEKWFRQLKKTLEKMGEYTEYLHMADKQPLYRLSRERSC